MLALPLVRPPVAEAQSAFDAQRVADLTEIVEAFEAYGAIHGTYKLDAGRNTRGEGQLSAAGTGSYVYSIGDGLIAAGVLDEVPVEPSPGGAPYGVFLCLNRVGVFSIDDDLSPDAADLAWWNSHDCPPDPLGGWGRTFFVLSDPLPFSGPPSVSPVSDVVSAIEAYGVDHGSYVIEGGGYDEKGYGWFSRRYSSAYDESVMNVLAQEGYLDADNMPEDRSALSSWMYGMYIQRCKNRVAVMALPSAASGAEPSTEDLDWWLANGCSTTRLYDDHGYFELTEALDEDQVRMDAADEIVAAMNAAAAATHTAFLDDMGYNEEGRGWYSFQNGTTYEVSIERGLAQAGYLDPFDLPADDPWEVLDWENGYLSFHCLNRRAVFTRSGGIEPSAEDAAWWSANSCPVPSSADHTYFVLTDPLPLDTIRQHAVSVIVAALEDYGIDHLTYAVAGAGYNEDGYGSFNAQNSAYDLSIANALRDGGYLEPDVVVREPLSRDGYDSNGIRVYQCEDRVGVFSLAETITPSAEDAAWWADNDCTASGTGGGRSYFQVSQPLPLDESVKIFV